MKRTLFATLALFSLGGQAMEYTQLDTTQSTLQFVFKQMAVPVEGRFKRFNGQIAFDPAKPAVARAELTIEAAGIDAGSPEANDEVGGKLWFDSKAHPLVRFVATAIKPAGKDRFDVTGRMTIKGHTQDVTAPATFRTAGNSAVLVCLG